MRTLLVASLVIVTMAFSAMAHELYRIGDVDGDPITLEIVASPVQGYVITITPAWCEPSHPPDPEPPEPTELPSKENAVDKCSGCHPEPENKYLYANWDNEATDYPNDLGAPEDKAHKKHKKTKADVPMPCTACHTL
jgi:hypothetical protein